VTPGRWDLSLSPVPPQIVLFLWSLDHIGAVDLGHCWWEGSAVCFDGSFLNIVLRVSFFVFRVKICRGGAQVVVAAPRAIRSSQLQPYLGGNVERLVGVVLSSTISSDCGNLRIVKKLRRQFFILLHLQDGCDLLNLFGDFSSATNNVRSTQRETAATARRRHGLEVEDEGLLKDLIVIFIFLICFVLFVVFILMSESYS
jgi:hypothetical protein